MYQHVPPISHVTSETVHLHKFQDRTLNLQEAIVSSGCQKANSYAHDEVTVRFSMGKLGKCHRYALLTRTMLVYKNESMLLIPLPPVPNISAHSKTRVSTLP